MPSLRLRPRHLREDYNVHDALVNGVPTPTLGGERLGALANNFSAYLVSG